ncbi:MAG TPA: VOC family protein [Patescibacteria group bacterium]|nr:VOC family protein [Patescibacteria group bacterium]
MFSHYRILIYSENPDKLMEFYQDVLELPLDQKLDIPNDYGYKFTVNGEWKVWIGKHSEVKGVAKEPFRHIFNIYVDSVEKWYEKIKDKAEIVCKPELAPFATEENQIYVCTFLDPEKNCWQFMGNK